MIWFVFAALTAGVILAITRPLGRASSVGSGSDIDAYRLQLRELERDAERGTVDPAEVEQTRIEISRRLLKASRRAGIDDEQTHTNRAASAIFAGIAAFVGLLSLGLYTYLGQPGFPDQPLEARLNMPVEQQPLNIQVANVERRLRAKPDDAAGWTVIAPIYFRLGDYEKSANAYRRSMALAGATEGKLLGFAEALTFGNQGTIPETARQPIKLAVEANPKSLRGRFWLALLAEQDGIKDEAEKIYRDMLGEGLPEMWRNVAQGRLAALSGTGTADTGQSGVSQGGQGAMIQAMVDGLAARLKQNGADLQGWLRLIRSYMVLKDAEKAGAAVASARRQFASDTASLKQIDDLAQTYGLAGGEQKTQ